MFIGQNCLFHFTYIRFQKIDKICLLDKIVYFILHILDFKKNKQICLLDKIIKQKDKIIFILFFFVIIVITYKRENEIYKLYISLKPSKIK